MEQPATTLAAAAAREAASCSPCGPWPATESFRLMGAQAIRSLAEAEAAEELLSILPPTRSRATFPHTGVQARITEEPERFIMRPKATANHSSCWTTGARADRAPPLG